jgi:hypothetical protein
MLDFVEGVWLVLMVPWVGEWVVTRQLSTSIFGRSSIIDETPTAFMPSMPCSRRTAMYDKLLVAISNLQSPCSLLILLVTSGSLSLCRNEATTPTCAGDSRLGLHSSCFVASSASSSAAARVCSPSSSTIRLFSASSSVSTYPNRALLSPVAKVCCRNCALSAACVWWCMRVRVAEEARVLTAAFGSS